MQFTCRRDALTCDLSTCRASRDPRGNFPILRCVVIRLCTYVLLGGIILTYNPDTPGTLVACVILYGTVPLGTSRTPGTRCTPGTSTFCYIDNFGTSTRTSQELLQFCTRPTRPPASTYSTMTLNLRITAGR